MVACVCLLLLCAPPCLQNTGPPHHRADLSVRCPGFALTRRRRRQSDPYAAAKELGIFETVDSGTTVTTHSIWQRIVQNYQLFADRNAVQGRKQVLCLHRCGRL